MVFLAMEAVQNQVDAIPFSDKQVARVPTVNFQLLTPMFGLILSGDEMKGLIGCGGGAGGNLFHFFNRCVAVEPGDGEQGRGSDQNEGESEAQIKPLPGCGHEESLLVTLYYFYRQKRSCLTLRPDIWILHRYMGETYNENKCFGSGGFPCWIFCCGRLSKREPLELIYLDKTGFIPGQTTVACLLSSKATVPTLDR